MSIPLWIHNTVGQTRTEVTFGFSVQSHSGNIWAVKLKPHWGHWSASVRAESQAVCSFELGSRPFCEESWASVFSPVKWSDIPREHLAHSSVMVCMLEADIHSLC